MIPGDCGPALDAVQNLGKFAVVGIGHLVTVGAAVAPCGVDIRRVAIKQRFRAVITLDNVERGRILDLDPKQTLSDQRQILDTSEPPGGRARHPGPAGQLAVRPPPCACGLRQSRPDLTRPDKKTTGAFAFGNPFGAGTGDGEFFPAERCQTDALDQRRLFTAKNTKEVD